MPLGGSGDAHRSSCGGGELQEAILEAHYVGIYLINELLAGRRERSAYMIDRRDASIRRWKRWKLLVNNDDY